MKYHKLKENLHAKKLEELCKPWGLKAINEDPEEVHVIIREPIVEKMGWQGLEKSPDLFIAKYNKKYTVVELKGSRDQRDKAYEQIESGIKLLVDVFGIPLKNITGKMVIYTPTTFKHEVLYGR